ncbi:MAG: 1-acyl-sn-glycerol-3-phosphate acyltransferase [Leptospira sp.]|nr:1-acyl-sn-glycerol-3-phosphate acyltransferase [Leptospira sp.]
MSIESFIPPKFNYPVVWFTDLAMPVLLKTIHNIDEVVILEEDKKMIRSLRGDRLIYISNHPSQQEPPIAYTVANTMYTRFHYMAAREVFSWGAGIVGEFIQSVGAFSVLAGTADRESLRTTRSILSAPGGKLVLFPEGEPTGAENDNLLPFQPGVSQLGFWGLEDARKNEPDADITVLPAFVKYRMNGAKEKIQSDVDRSLEVMEDLLGIGKKGKDVVHRLLSVGKRLVERAEKEFHVRVKEDESFDFRVGHLRHAILNNIAEKIEIKKWNEKDHAIDKLRKILTTIEMVLIGLPDPKNELPPMDAARWARLACQRAYDFIAVKTDYITAFPSAERIYEWIYRFENELLGKKAPRPHNAYVHFAKPFRLGEYYEEYKKDKKASVDRMTARLKTDIQTMLDREVKNSEILFPENHIF